ncbi:PTS sugar transporter subunit IIA [Neobacillus jeddahensis]|uniref:PTS sugar transporter subunit IIA n=1 Tax=Neobacillus jeddahensis TaxID=1461580 RepID=UPI0005900E0D|nr:PTS glucose transporter subunit IIA [Neobacillus jeddahensis]
MGFKLFKKEKTSIYAPVQGEIIPITDVPDPVFSQKMMGEGLAIIPEQGNIYAPVNGKVILVASTKHAIGIRAEDGTEILIHVGLETVALNGVGFELAVQEGDKIKPGQLLLEVDWDYLKEHAKSIVTPVVITNSAESGRQISLTEEKRSVAGETVIMTI